jgi:general secretion pathway protein D
MKKAVLIALITLSIAGCATDQAYREGQRLLDEGKTEEGIKSLEQAVRDAPGNAQYRATLAHSREAYFNRLLAEGDAALNAGRLQEAEARYRDVLKLHPENRRAATGLSNIEIRNRNSALLRESEAALKKGDYEIAQVKLRTILAQQPDHAEAARLLKLAEEKAGRARGVEFPQLTAGLHRPVTLEFRDAPLKSVMDAISRQGGFNIVFDKDVRMDQKATVFARDTALVDALDMLLATNQLARKVLDANTLLVYPNQAAKRKDYEDVVVKSFFLSNVDAKQAVNMIKSMAKVRDIYMDEGLNMIMVRDTPEAVRLVEKLVNVADRPEPEVMLEVQIMEVNLSRLVELGVQWPTQLSVISPAVETQTTTDGGVAINTTNTGLLTLSGLKNLTGADIAVSPNPSFNMRGEDSDVKLLANPRIRVRNKEKAKIHIGDKVPVITSNTTSTGVVSESVSYLDVGLKLDVEPRVHLDGDVAIKIGMEVSNIVSEVSSATGTLTYQLGSRNANTVLRLRDGETQMLAGLISDEDRGGVSKFPGLGDLPIIGRLFSSHRDEKSKTEIVLLITPHIIRNIERPQLSEGEFFAGTESTASDQPLRLRPATGVTPPRLPPPAPVRQENAQESPAAQETAPGNAAPVENPTTPPEN